jgi:hypothetical protein
VTDQPPALESSEDPTGTERLRAERLARAQQRSLFQLIPRKELAKAALLVVVLIVIIALQRQSGSIVKRLTEGLMGPPAPALKHEAPRVRMAPPAKAR